MASSISAQIKLEGGKQFANDFKTAASAVKSANSELKYLDNTLERNGKSTDTLSQKMNSLSKAMEAEKQTIDTLRQRMSELEQMTGVDTTQAVNNLNTELYKHMDNLGRLESEYNNTKTELQNFTTEADKAGNETKDLGDKTEDTSGDVGNFSDKLAKSIVSLQTWTSLTLKAAGAAAKWIGGIAKDAVAYNAELESAQATIEAFFRTAGEGAEEANANAVQLIENQKTLSSLIGIGTDKLLDANKMLIASGVSGADAQVAIEALAKAVVATGGGNEELSRMAQNLQQISNTGKASSVDLKQFAMAGIDVLGLLADQTGKTTEQLKEQGVTYEQIVSALQQATSEGGKFFDAAQSGASTLNGKINTLKSTIKDGLGTAFQPLSEALTNEIIPELQEFADTVDWEAMGATISDAVGGAVKALELLVGAFSKLSTWLQKSKADAENNKNAAYGAAGAHAAWAKRMEEASNAVYIQGQKVKGTSQLMTQANAEIINEARKLNSLGAESGSWGQHLVQGFASGIRNETYLVQRAVSGVANAVVKVMKFSRPDEGPLHNYEEWMPHMMQGFEKGINDNMYRIQNAATNVASTLAAPQSIINGGINLTVNGAQGQDVSALADEVMDRIQKATNRRVTAWA